MKKLYKGLLILVAILLTGCSLKGSMAQPTDDTTKEPSKLQSAVEDQIEETHDLEDKTEEYKNAMSEVLNNINSGQATETETETNE